MNKCIKSMCNSNIRKLISHFITGLFPEMMQQIDPQSFWKFWKLAPRTASFPNPSKVPPPSTPFWIAGVTGALTGITGGAGGESDLGALTWKMATFPGGKSHILSPNHGKCLNPKSWRWILQMIFLEKRGDF